MKRTKRTVASSVGILILPNSVEPSLNHFCKPGDAALKAVETSKNMRLSGTSTAKRLRHKGKLNEEKRRTAELSKLLATKQNESQQKNAESEKLKNELLMKEKQLREEMTQRAELLKRLTEYEKGRYAIDQAKTVFI